jgi:lysozyme
MDESQARTRIADYEGNIPHMYHDSKGIKTIGIGFNLERSGAKAAIEAVGADFDKVCAGEESLTEDQIGTLFSHDLQHAIDEASSVVSSFGSLNDPRQFVIVDMIFNMGAGGVAGFHHTIQMINEGDFEAAGAGMKDSHWYGQVGVRAEKDVHMMITGEWA